MSNGSPIPKHGNENQDDLSILVIADMHKDGRRKKRGCLITFGLWLAAIGVFFWIGKMPAPGSQKWEWLSTVACIVMLILAPAVGILQAIDLKSYLDWQDKKTAGNAGFRFLIILGCWLMALVCGSVGSFGVCAVFGAESEWGLWKTLPALLLCLAFVVLALFFLVLPFRRGTGPTEAEARAAGERYQQQMAHPDFAGIERQSGMTLPLLYKSLFAPESPWLGQSWFLYPGGLEDDTEIYDVESLVPAHPDALWQSSAGKGTYLVFAEGDCTKYLIQLGTDDPPVFSLSTENDEADDAFIRIAEHLSAFLNWQKEAM